MEFINKLSYGNIVGLIIIICLGYFIAVIIYLSILKNKYLHTTSRDKIIGSKSLKNYQELIESFKDKKILNVLILSGGGVRGMIPLRILSYVEKVIGKKTGELFDFIAGSSTGAISAAALAVGDETGYKYSAKDILEHYIENISKIFAAPWYHQLLTMFGLFAPRYIPDGKLKVLTEYYSNLTIGELRGNLLIPVYNIDNNSLEFIKNWDTPHGQTNPNYLVTDLINGASNPPMLFPPVAFSIGIQNYLFIDPAVLLNNPILYVLLYIKAIFPDTHLNITLIENGAAEVRKYDYRNMFSFGLYGVYQYLFRAPSLSSKLYIDFVEKYLIDTQKQGHNVTFYNINSCPTEPINPKLSSIINLNKIKIFANRMLQENMPTINKLIHALKIQNEKI